MADEITITPKSESTSTPIEQPNQNANSARRQFTNLCAAGLGFSFFLPWAQFLGAHLSGFDLQKMGDEHKLLWLIPIFSAITIFAGATKRGQKNAAQLAGALPFMVGIYWYRKIGNDLFQILDIGAYLSLTFGAALLVLPEKTK